MTTTFEKRVLDLHLARLTGGCQMSYTYLDATTVRATSDLFLNKVENDQFLSLSCSSGLKHAVFNSMLLKHVACTTIVALFPTLSHYF